MVGAGSGGDSVNIDETDDSVKLTLFLLETRKEMAEKANDDELHKPI